MVLLRALTLLLLLVSVVYFARYMATGQTRYLQLGLQILKWTLLVAFGFFAILIAQRVFLL